jgi:membrane protein implicated in regulation of membrane protease activity
MSDVEPADSGLASGIVNTAFMLGGALGLAVLASLAAKYTGNLIASGATPVAALNGGYQLAFAASAVFAIAAALLGALWLRNLQQASTKLGNLSH